MSKFHGENFSRVALTTKFVNVFSLESFPLYGLGLPSSHRRKRDALKAIEIKQLGQWTEILIVGKKLMFGAFKAITFMQIFLMFLHEQAKNGAT